MHDTAQLADELDRELQSQASPERAEHEKAYLKSVLDHYGTSVPRIRAAVRDLCRRVPDLSRADVLGIADDLWTRGVHEDRMAAVELLVARADLLDADDLDLIEDLVIGARTWAIVDPLAINVVGVLLDRDPTSVVRRLDQWAVHEDLWLRRTALLAHLPSLRKGEGDFETFTHYADRMSSEREFFIRKAIGWVLREAGKRRPEAVTAWVGDRIHMLSGVTVREAVKPLPQRDRERLLTAYAAGRRRT